MNRDLDTLTEATKGDIRNSAEKTATIAANCAKWAKQALIEGPPSDWVTLAAAAFTTQTIAVKVAYIHRKAQANRFTHEEIAHKCGEVGELWAEAHVIGEDTQEFYNAAQYRWSSGTSL